MEKGREFWIEESQTNCQWDLLRKRGKWLFWRQKDYYAQENEKKKPITCVKWNGFSLNLQRKREEEIMIER